MGKELWIIPFLEGIEEIGTVPLAWVDLLLLNPKQDAHFRIDIHKKQGV